MNRVLWGSLALLVTVAGCGEEDDPGVEAIDYAQQERDAICDYRVRCGFSTDRDACLGSVERSRATIQAIGGIDSERVDYDRKAALAYVELLEEAGCEATIANGRALEAARAEVLQGSVAAGDSCFADTECAGERALCDQTGCGGQICCEGTCAEIQTLSLGSACPLFPIDADRLTAFCEDTAYCAPPPDDGSGEPPAMGTCQPRADNGEPCDRNEACLDGQRCAMDQCFVLSTAGQPCNPTLTTGSCVEANQVCDMASSTCVDAPGDGQPCVFGQCMPYASCVEDVCVRRPVQGESCEGTPPCQGDLQCRDNICALETVVFVCLEGEPPPPPEGE